MLRFLKLFRRNEKDQASMQIPFLLLIHDLFFSQYISEIAVTKNGNLTPKHKGLKLATGETAYSEINEFWWPKRSPILYRERCPRFPAV